MKKIIISVSISVFLLFSLVNSINAASFNVSSSTSSITIGDRFQVYIKGQIAGRFNISTNNGSVSSSAVFIDNVGDGAIISCTPSSVGTATITVTAADVTDASYQEVSGSSSVSVKVNEKSPSTTPEYSRPAGSTSGSTQGTKPEIPKVDLKLSKLEFSVGILEPVFQPGITEYILKDIPLETTKINVDAKATSKDVKIVGGGMIDISSSKEIIINIKDNNSSQQMIYKILCKYIEKPILTVKTSQDKNIGIFNDKSLLSPLEGFQDETIKIDNKDIPIKKKDDLILVYGVNDKGVKNYYVYQDKQITSIYKPVVLLGQQLVVVDVPTNKINQWLKSSTIEIDKQIFECFEFEMKHMSNYCLLYFMDKENNERFYQYDKTMNTLQIYSGTIPLLEQEYNELIDSKNIIIYILSGISILLTGSIGFMLYQRKKGRL